MELPMNISATKIAYNSLQKKKNKEKFGYISDYARL